MTTGGLSLSKISFLRPMMMAISPYWYLCSYLFHTLTLKRLIVDLKHTSTMAKKPLFIWSSLLIRSTCSCADKYIAVVKMNVIGHILAALMYWAMLQTERPWQGWGQQQGKGGMRREVREGESEGERETLERKPSSSFFSFIFPASADKSEN